MYGISQLAIQFKLINIISVAHDKSSRQYFGVSQQWNSICMDVDRFLMFSEICVCCSTPHYSICAKVDFVPRSHM